MEHCRLTKYVCRRQFHFVPMKTTKRRHDYFRFIDKEIGPKEVCAFPRLCLRFMEEEDLNTGFPRPPASTSPGWQGAPSRWWTCGTSTIVTGSTALSHGSHDTAAWPAGHMQTRALGPSPPCLTQQAWGGGLRIPIRASSQVKCLLLAWDHSDHTPPQSTWEEVELPSCSLPAAASCQGLTRPLQDAADHQPGRSSAPGLFLQSLRPCRDITDLSLLGQVTPSCWQLPGPQCLSHREQPAGLQSRGKHPPGASSAFPALLPGRRPQINWLKSAWVLCPSIHSEVSPGGPSWAWSHLGVGQALLSLSHFRQENYNQL